MLVRSPSPKPARRARQARYRQRVAAGRMAITVEVDAAILDLLVRSEWLNEEVAGDKLAIGDAIARLLAATAKIE